MGAIAADLILCFAKTALGYNFNNEDQKNMDSYKKQEF